MFPTLQNDIFLRALQRARSLHTRLVNAPSWPLFT